MNDDIFYYRHSGEIWSHYRRRGIQARVFTIYRIHSLNPNTCFYTYTYLISFLFNGLLHGLFEETKPTWIKCFQVECEKIIFPILQWRFEETIIAPSLRETPVHERRFELLSICNLSTVELLRYWRNIKQKHSKV